MVGFRDGYCACEAAGAGAAGCVVPGDGLDGAGLTGISGATGAAGTRRMSGTGVIVGLLSGSVENGTQALGSVDGLSAKAQTQRRLGLALTVNLVVLVLVALVAIMLLIVAWHGGF